MLSVWPFWINLSGSTWLSRELCCFLYLFSTDLLSWLIILYVCLGVRFISHLLRFYYWNLLSEVVYFYMRKLAVDRSLKQIVQESLNKSILVQEFKTGLWFLSYRNCNMITKWVCQSELLFFVLISTELRVLHYCHLKASSNEPKCLLN